MSATLLDGIALAVWLELSNAEQKSYKDKKAKIIEQMGPMQFTSMDNFTTAAFSQENPSPCLCMN